METTTLSNQEPLSVRIEDVRKAIDILHQQQLDNMRLRMHPMMLYGFKVIETKQFVYFDASA